MAWYWIAEDSNTMTLEQFRQGREDWAERTLWHNWECLKYWQSLNKDQKKSWQSRRHLMLMYNHERPRTNSDST